VNWRGRRAAGALENAGRWRRWQQTTRETGSIKEEREDGLCRERAGLLRWQWAGPQARRATDQPANTNALRMFGRARPDVVVPLVFAAVVVTWVVWFTTAVGVWEDDHD